MVADGRRARRRPRPGRAGPLITAIALAAPVVVSSGPASAAPLKVFLSSLSAVSCTSGPNCMAVGSYNASGGPSTFYTLTEEWNGTAWSYVPSPTPPDQSGGGELQGVSCISESSCVAVGIRVTYHRTNGYFTYAPLSEVWNGASWRVVQVPSPAAEGAVLNAVSCTTVSACVAVGSAGPRRRPGSSLLAERWNGTSWTILPTAPLTARGGRGLAGVSCPGATSCVAAGFDHDFPEPGNEMPVVQSWHGTTWKNVPSPSGEGALAGVSCSGPSSCVAAGVRDGSPPGPTPATLAEIWNGASWTVATTPNPHHAFAAYLQAVSCTAPAACVATGYWYSQEAENSLTLTEVWNGKVWALARSPSPGTVGDDLVGVSCASATDCMAVGSGPARGGTNGGTLAESWNGTAWKVLKTPEGPAA